MLQGSSANRMAHILRTYSRPKVLVSTQLSWLRWLANETSETFSAAFGRLRAGPDWRLVYCLCCLRVRRQLAAVVSRFGRHLWNRGIRCPSPYRPDGPENPPA